MYKRQDPVMKLALKVVRTLKRYAKDEAEGLKVLKIATVYYSSDKNESIPK